MENGGQFFDVFRTKHPERFDLLNLLRYFAFQIHGLHVVFELVLICISRSLSVRSYILWYNLYSLSMHSLSILQKVNIISSALQKRCIHMLAYEYWG